MGRQCEHIDYPDDGGWDRCDREDTMWYENFITGTAGFYCPSHWPYDQDVKTVKLIRARIEQERKKPA